MKFLPLVTSDPWAGHETEQQQRQQEEEELLSGTGARGELQRWRRRHEYSDNQQQQW